VTLAQHGLGGLPGRLERVDKPQNADISALDGRQGVGVERRKQRGLRLVRHVETFRHSVHGIPS
jgi:hypothetical protein